MRRPLLFICLAGAFIGLNGCSSNRNGSARSVVLITRELGDTQQREQRLRLQNSLLLSYAPQLRQIEANVKRPADEFAALVNELERLRTKWGRPDPAPKKADAPIAPARRFLADDAQQFQALLLTLLFAHENQQNRAEELLIQVGTQIELNRASALTTSYVAFAPVAGPSGTLPFAQTSAGGGGSTASSTTSMLARYIPQTNTLLDRFRTAGEDMPVASLELWDAAKNELNGLSKVFDGSPSRQRLLKELDDTQSKFKQSTDYITKQITDQEKRTADLNKELAAADDVIGQSQINQLLVGAVFMMLVIIGLVFYYLAKKPEDIVKMLIQERILIEVLSMGFLLLTVIILGTGKLLNQEALAAVLGTITGYIFGQKVAQAGGRATILPRSGDQEQADAPAPPPPAPPPPAQPKGPRT